MNLAISRVLIWKMSKIFSLVTDIFLILFAAKLNVSQPPNNTKELGNKDIHILSKLEKIGS